MISLTGRAAFRNLGLRRGGGLAILAAIVLGLSSCQTIPSIDQQTRALTLSNQSLSSRQHQSRRFDTGDEAKILTACAGVLQDLGFIITESSSSAGLLVASKDRSRAEPGQKFWAAMGGQRIRISVVTTPLKTKTVLVRVTFQRIIWHAQSQFSRVESINDPLIYQEFFNRLSQSIFLEAHQL